MIVKNESRLVKQALLSVIDVIDNAVIVDTGSTDNTCEIITSFFQQHNKELLLKEIPWEDDFSKARNEGIKEVKNGNYIIILDADQKLALARNPLKSFYEYPEKIYPAKNEILRRYLIESKGTYYYCTNFNVTDIEYWESNRFLYQTPDPGKITNFPYYNPVIFIKSPGLKYFLPVHETPLRLDEGYKETVISRDTLITIIHTGYSHQHKKQNQFSNSLQRNISLIKKSIASSAEIQKSLSSFNKNRISTRIFENKRKLAGYLLASGKPEEALKGYKEIFSEFEKFRQEGLLDTERSFFTEKTFLKAALTAFQIKSFSDNDKLKLCKDIFGHFEVKEIILSEFYAISSEIKLMNYEKYSATEILKEILLSMVPQNTGAVDDPQAYSENWFAGKEKFLPWSPAEINYYIVTPEVFYKFMPLVRLGEYFIYKAEPDKAARVMEMSRSAFLYAYFNCHNNHFYRHTTIQADSFIRWIKRYIPLLYRLEEMLLSENLINNLNDYRNFVIKEVEYFSGFYYGRLRKFICEDKEIKYFEKLFHK